MLKKYNGSCFCGAIQYEIAIPIKFIAHDHCSICRRLSGAAFVTWGGVKSAQFNLIKGKDKLTTFKSSPEAERQFCSICGSQLFFRSSKWEGEVHFTRATINDHINEQAKAHVFYSDKADWIDIKDDLPRYGGKSGLEPLA